MKKLSLLLLSLSVILILGGASCGYSATTTPTGNTNTGGNTNTPVNSSTVNIQNFAFNPSTLTVAKGTTVTWTNSDSAIHRIKSDTFNSNDLAQGQTFKFTFNATGTFNYSCAIHPSMLGTIIVQ